VLSVIHCITRLFQRLEDFLETESLMSFTGVKKKRKRKRRKESQFPCQQVNQELVHG